MYQAAAGPKPDGTPGPWIFRVYAGIYGHSRQYLSRWFEQWKPDAIICQVYGHGLATLYRQLGIPVVELFERTARSPFHRILPDDIATGELAARHFLERGYRHFAFFGLSSLSWARKRCDGFKAEIERAFEHRRENGLESEFTLASTGPFTFDEAVPPADRRHAVEAGAWLRSLPKPLALFAANDLWGFELIQAARESGLNVPDDVAVLGVDNDELLCEVAHPPLSSIRIGGERMGRLAVSVLDDVLSGRRLATSIPPVPPVGVVSRQSTDCMAVTDPDVAIALRRIRQQAITGMSVKELLAGVSVNRRTLERRFLRALGHTLLEEIHRVRLNRAKELLQGDLPIYEVAQRSGFSTPEYLATSFLRSAGETPTDYRRKYAVRGL
jgi:LacI family transcriptional regulator